MTKDFETGDAAIYKNIGVALHSTARAWRKRADAIAARLGLSEAAGWALLTLQHTGDGTHLATLADAMGLEGPSVSRLLTTLINAGLVERRDDPADGRAKTLHVTAAGQDICTRLNELLHGVRAYLLQDVSHEDMLVLLRVCGNIQGRADAPVLLGRPEDLG